MSTTTVVLHVLRNRRSVGALALSGVPPFNGFASKWTIYLAGIQAGPPVGPVLTIIAVIISALTLAYLLKAFSMIFLGPRPQRFKDVKEAPYSILFPMLILAVFCVALGVLPQIGLDIVEPARESLLDHSHYIKEVLSAV